MFLGVVNVKVKDVTNDMHFLIRSMKKNAQWPDSQIKIYDSKTTRFVHEYSEKGQLISLSRRDKPLTKKDKKFALKKLVKRSKSDVHAYTSPNGVLYLRQDI